MASSLTFGHLHWSDILVISLYYVGSLGIGIYTICRTKNNLNSVFLAGRSLTWWPIGMSLFASNIGSINFVGIAGSAAVSGIAVVMFEWSAIFLLVALGWIFVPVYMTSGIYTIPEYLHKRFGGQRLRVYLSVIALLTYIFAILSVDLYSGALFIQTTVGWNIYIGVAIILGTTFLFTVLGGLTTVVLTDAFAVIVMISGGILLFILGMIKIGGFKELYVKYNAAIPNVTLPNNTCGYPRQDAWHLFRDSIHGDYPGLGTLLRTTFGAMWFWCSNQLIVQRSLAAKNIKHAKGGSLLACYLKLTPMIIMVIPGMISRALFPNEIACATPDLCKEICGNPSGCSNNAYPKLAVELLPNGLRGLLIAAMLAAVISSLTSIFNSSSSMVTMDIWTRFRPKAQEKEQMIVAKVFQVILVAGSVAWIPTMQHAEGGQIYRYAVASVGLFGGPTCGIFLVAIFCARVNEKGAFWGLILGQLWGLSRFILDAIYPAPPCGENDNRPAFLKYWHVYYHCISQIILTILISLIISLLTKRPEDSQLAGTTFWTRYDKREHDISEFEENYQTVPLQDARFDDQSSSDEQENCHKIQSNHESCTYNKDVNVQSKSFKNKLVTIFKYFCEGNEQYLQSSNDYSRLQSLHESTFWTVFLNINAFIVVAIVTGLYIYLR